MLMLPCSNAEYFNDDDHDHVMANQSNEAAARTTQQARVKAIFAGKYWLLLFTCSVLCHVMYLHVTDIGNSMPNQSFPQLA